MNGIEKITDKIASEAEAENAHVLEKARLAAAEVVKKYEEKAKEAVAEALETGRKAADAQEKKHASNAGLESRKLLLAKKQQLIDRAFDLALDHLCAMPESEYRALLVRLICEAAETGKEALIFSPADRGRLGKEVVMAANKNLSEQGKIGEITLSAETRPIKAGVIVTRGDVEINCALETIVRLSRDALSSEVAHALFG